METRIELVNMRPEAEGLLTDTWYAPLGILGCATALLREGRAQVALRGPQNDQSSFNADIIGLSFNLFAAEEASRVAQQAKRCGAVVIVGGPVATHLPEQLLKNIPEIDAVVRYDGEPALLHMATAIAKDDVPFMGCPNIVCRQPEGFYHGPVEHIIVESQSIPDRFISGLNLEQYIAAFTTSNSDHAITGHRVTNAHTKRGCARRCSFCGRIDRHFRSRTPSQTAEEYRLLHSDWQIDHVFDHSDTWAYDHQWLAAFAEIYCGGRNGDPTLSIFADSRDITEHSADLLKRIGVTGAFMGIESGDEAVLRENGKPIDPAQAAYAVQLLTDHGIRVSTSYVLGLLGEDEHSLQATSDFALNVHHSSPLVSSYFTIIMPLPGSHIWDRMMSVPLLQEKYGQTIFFDMEALRRDFVAHFCHLGPEGIRLLTDTRDGLLGQCGQPVLEYAR